MYDELREAFDAVASRRKTIEVCSPSADVAAETAGQFATRNVAVVHRRMPSVVGDGFVVLRDEDDEFLSALALETFAAMLSPEVHPPWVLAETDVDHEELFDFLEGTLFDSFDRRQMLATTREIEERAWRVGAGRLHVGFQRPAALHAQADVYRRLASRNVLSVEVYVDASWEQDDPWPGVGSGDIAVHAETAAEIGRFWLLLFDGAGVDVQKCGLLAEERSPGRYYGFWTYDPGTVDALVGYLETAYGGD